jgi:hypothetical protein
MELTKLLVTLAGFAAIGWVLWYFLVPPERSAGPRGRRGGAP